MRCQGWRPGPQPVLPTHPQPPTAIQKGCASTIKLIVEICTKCTRYLKDKALEPIITQCKRSKTYKQVNYGGNTFVASTTFDQGVDALFLYTIIHL